MARYVVARMFKVLERRVEVDEENIKEKMTMIRAVNNAVA